MIKAIFRPGGQRLLGLTEENLTRLRNDQPIRVRLEELSLGPGELFIVYGPTEEHIKNELKDVLSLQTEIVDRSTPADVIAIKLRDIEKMMHNKEYGFPASLISAAVEHLSAVQQLMIAYKETNNQNLS